MKAGILFVIILGFCFSLNSQTSPIVYGLARTSNPNAVWLAKINPITGSVTNISTATVATGEQVPSGFIDPVNSRYYFKETFGNLVGLDLLTGSVVSNTTITNQNATLWDMPLYNCKNATVYGLARTSNPNAVWLAKINPATGSVTNISSSSVATGEQVPSGFIDPVNNRYYFRDTFGNLIGLDLLTGSVVSNTTITNQNATYWDMPVYNCKDSTVYGLARTSSPNAVWLAKINPTTGVVTNISTSSVATGEQVPSAFIDYTNNRYYFKETLGNLVGLDILTGSVVSNTAITNQNATYWDMPLTSYSCCSVQQEATSIASSERQLSNIMIFPNPVSDILFIENSWNDACSIELCDLNDKTILRKESTDNKTDLNISDQHNGFYIIKISNKKQTIVKKVVIIH